MQNKFKWSQKKKEGLKMCFKKVDAEMKKCKQKVTALLIIVNFVYSTAFPLKYHKVLSCI